MLTSDQPWAAWCWDSARVENRGPSITTIVPPAVTSGAAVATASPSREQYGSANGRWQAPDST